MQNFKVNCVETRVNEYKEEYGQFIFEPLDLSQGITLGNSLRRILLNDLEGLAIVGIRIAGINHEFCSIPGVREDILEIILNLKEVVLKGNINEPILGKLRKQGPAIVTAGLIKFPGISVVNPNKYIATIADNSVLEIEFKVDKGKSYQLSESDSTITPIDFLSIDSIFMPVSKVNFEVEKIEEEKKERLILELWTNGSISAENALFLAGKVFRNLLEPLNLNNFCAVPNQLKQEKKRLEDIKIEELGLSARVYNGLKRAQIHSVEELAKYSLDDLKAIKNFGNKSVQEVLKALKDVLGVNLKKDNKVNSNS